MTEAPDRPLGRVHPLVKLFVGFHVFMVVVWTLPSAAPAIASGSVPATVGNVLSHPGDFLLKANSDFRYGTPLKHYLLYSGLWQYWDMFAPNPTNMDYWYDSVVTYRSGAKRVVPYPRMYSYPVQERYFKERYRKFIERINDDVNDVWKRPTFAQRMALIGFTDPNDPPVKVELRRHFRRLAGPEKPLPAGYQTYTFHAQIVDQAKLAKDKGL